MNTEANHMQTLERAMAVGTRMVEETLAPHLIITTDDQRYSIVAADDFDDMPHDPGAAPKIVCHMNI